MFTHVAHFDRKVGIYIGTKLFQLSSCKEPHVILAGPDGFFRPSPPHRVRPSENCSLLGTDNVQGQISEQSNEGYCVYYPSVLKVGNILGYSPVLAGEYSPT